MKLLTATSDGEDNTLQETLHFFKCAEPLLLDNLPLCEHHYYFSNLPPTTPLKTLVRIARSRCAIEVQSRDLKSELGLDHFEGRSYPGRNHNGVLAAMTYTYLRLERRRRREPLPTFPEMLDLMREVMAALLWTTRPGWAKLAISFQRNPPLRI